MRPSLSKGVARARFRPEKRKSGMALHLSCFGSGEIEPDCLQLCVLIVRVDGVVATAEAGLLEAAEWRRDVSLAEGVDGDRAGLQRTRGAHRALAVGREDRGREPIVGIVCN